MRVFSPTSIAQGPAAKTMRAASALAAYATTVLIIAAFATLATYWVARLGIYFYVSLYPAFGSAPRPPEAALLAVKNLLSEWGTKATFFAVVCVCVRAAAPRALGASTASGVLVGLASVALVQAVVLLLYPPLTLEDLSFYVALGAAAGYLGAVWAQRALDSLNASRTAADRAAHDLARAREIADVPAAVGSAFARILDPSGAVAASVWGSPAHARALASGAGPGSSSSPDSDDRETDGLCPLASWTSDRVSPRRVAGVPEAAPRLADLSRGEAAVVVPVHQLFPGEPELQEAFRSAVAVPLRSLDPRHGGVLLLLRKTGRRLPAAVAAHLTTAGNQAGSVVENIRLLAEARASATRGERSRLWRDLHDTVSPRITATKMQLGLALMSEDPESFIPGGPARQKVEEGAAQAGMALREAREIVWDLRPEALGVSGLRGALQTLVSDTAARSGADVRLDADPDGPSLSPQTEAALYRVSQEALSNAERHAHAARIRVTLAYLDDVVLLDIKDDGVGIPSAATTPADRPAPDGPSGSGLFTMRARVETLGGTFVADGDPGAGTSVSVKLPARPPAAAP